LVNAGGRVDVEDRTGKTPLLIAMQAGHEETARALIREGGPVIARVW
jgi:ankyrin repeat protein